VISIEVVFVAGLSGEVGLKTEVNAAFTAFDLGINRAALAP
jgi:hypothetical protein